MKNNNNTFSKKIRSMISVDFRRMFTSPFFYIMFGISTVMPILILIMTTMMDGSVSINPQTGAETVMEGFDNVWQIIGSLPGSTDSASMDIVSMCNINLIFFMAAVLICTFIIDDFKSGFSKNIFAIRAKKSDYVISKTLVGFIGGALMIIGFFMGSIIGGAISGLPFTTENFSSYNIVMCIISKIFLMSVFTGIYTLMGIIAKQKLWLSILLSMGVGMFLFTMIPMITPINSELTNVLICFVGGILFCTGLGAISRLILKKRDIL